MADDENRDKRRQRVLKGATILTGITNSEVKCTVRNMHAGGAELKVSIDARVPDEFLLKENQHRPEVLKVIRGPSLVPGESF